MKNLIIVCLVFIATPILSKDKGKIIGEIRDHQTGETISYATVYYENESMHGTITNEMGIFELDSVSKGTVIKVSHLLYNDTVFQTTNFNSRYTIHLQSAILELPLAEVDGKYAEKLTQRAYKKAKTIEKNWRGKGFYRQLSQQGDLYTEVIESFCNIDFSNRGIKDWKVKEGRFGKSKAKNLLRFTNFSYFNRAFPIYATYGSKKKRATKTYIALSNKFNDFSFEVEKFIQKSNGQEIAVIHCIPNKTHPLKNTLLVESWYYIDTENFDIYRAKSVIHHPLGLNIDNPKLKMRKPIYVFDFNYKRDDSKKMILDYIRSSASFSIFEQEEFLYDFKINSIFHCYDVFTSKNIKHKKQKKDLDDLSEAAEANYNPVFWNNHQVIKKTPIESKVIIDFEKAGFFGNFSQ